MEIITSVSNNTIKNIKKLRVKKYRDELKKFIIENKHLIEEAHKLNKLEYIITSDLDYQVDSVEMIYVSKNVIDSLSLLKSGTKYIGIASYLEEKLDYSNDIVVLDNVQNPNNLGAILRNALAFNFKNIVLGHGCASIYNEKVIQACQGALFSLNISYKDLEKEIPVLKTHDYKLIGSSLEKAKPLNTSTFENAKIALFFGNEGSGISQSILNLMDYSYFIPIANIDSLNVASASAIIFYQINKNN